MTDVRKLELLILYNIPIISLILGLLFQYSELTLFYVLNQISSSNDYYI